MKVKHLIATMAIAVTSFGPAVAQDAATVQMGEEDTQMRLEHFEDAMFFRDGLREQVLSLIDPSDELAITLVEYGGVSSPGKAVMVQDEVFYIFDTCLMRRCDEQSLRMVIAPGGDVFIKNTKSGSSDVRGTVDITPKVQEIMDFWG